MASSINASTSGAGGVITTADNTGILNLQTASTNAVTIDTSQNVGIGTSSPAAKLHVSGSSSNIVASFDKGAANQAGVHLKNSAQTYTTYVDINNNGTNWWSLYDVNNDDLIDVYVPLSYRAFYTAGTERMRIDSSGNVLVGTTVVPSSASTSGVSIVNNSGTSGRITFGKTASGTLDGALFYFGATYVGGITYSNTATAYNTSSDYRLKENIVPMTGALDKVLQLKPVTYTWKADGSNGQGFIAHELQAVVPDCVVGEKDAVETYTDEEGNEQTRIKPQGVDTSFLVATLTAAIQEQQTIINDLKARVTALEAK